jgi:transposase
MKNKYLKGAHLSERKFRELLKLFCEDLTATQIANISDISRVTVNNYLKLIRTHIAKYCEEKNPRYYNNGYIPFIPINGLAIPLESEETTNRKALFGIYKNTDKIHADVIIHHDSKEVIDWAKGKLNGHASAELNKMLAPYNAIADFNNYKLHRVINEKDLSKQRTHLDEVDFFWGSLKSRIAKFRGLSGHTLFLHVKETEFRYNNRNGDLFELLTFIIQRRPLHYSRAI